MVKSLAAMAIMVQRFALKSKPRKLLKASLRNTFKSFSITVKENLSRWSFVHILQTEQTHPASYQKYTK